MHTKGGVYVMEGCLYTNIIRYFFPGRYPVDKIIEYYDNLMIILEQANPHIIHLYRPDVEKNYRKAFAVRGKRWESVITDGNDEYDFTNEIAYQTLAKRIFADYQGKKLAIDTSDDEWTNYYKQICDFLGIDFFSKQYISVSKPEMYTGHFEYHHNDEEESVTVICEGNELYCSPSWFTHIKINAIGEHEFELSAFPMVFKYSFTEDYVAITVSGNYDWGIVGKTLKRVN